MLILHLQIVQVGELSGKQGIPICLLIVCGCCQATGTELSSCDRDYKACKSLKYLLSGPSQ